MPTAPTFDITEHINKPLGPLIVLFPGDLCDWPNAARYKWVEHLKEVREICVTLDRAGRGLQNQSSNLWSRVLWRAYTRLTPTQQKEIKTRTSEWIAIVDDLINQIGSNLRPPTRRDVRETSRRQP